MVTLFCFPLTIQFLNERTLPDFLEEVSNTTVVLSEQVTQSPNDIESLVRILNNVATLVTTLLIQISREMVEVCVCLCCFIKQYTNGVC